MRYLSVTVVSTLCLGLAAGNAPAQPHGGHHGGHHAVHVPIHHGTYYGHNNWHHVVPHRPNYVGAYYTTGTTHYYTPSPVVPILPIVPPVVAAGTPAPPPPAPVEVQKPIELTFGDYSRYEDLAGRLAFEANALCLDLHYNYKHNKDFAEVYGEAYAILQAAKYIHGKEHKGDRPTLNKRMVEVDKLFHHVQDEMRGWTRVAAKQVGEDALPEKIASVEAVLHHLCYDVGVKPHEPAAAKAPPPADLNEVAPPPPPAVKP